VANQLPLYTTIPDDFTGPGDLLAIVKVNRTQASAEP
jgi:hypothetical protein